MTPDQFARLISRASDDQLDAVLARPELRESVIDEIFRRMSEHHQPEHAKRSHAVVNWRIGKSDDHRPAQAPRSAEDVHLPRTPGRRKSPPRRPGTKRADRAPNSRSGAGPFAFSL